MKRKKKAVVKSDGVWGIGILIHTKFPHIEIRLGPFYIDLWYEIRK